MAEGAERHDDGRNSNKAGGKFLDLIGGIVDTREKSAHDQHCDSHDHTAEHTENSGTKILSHDDTDAGTELDVYDIEKICDRRCDIQSGNHFQTSDGVTLCHGSHAGSPQHLIHHQREAFDQDRF